MTPASTAGSFLIDEVLWDNESAAIAPGIARPGNRVAIVRIENAEARNIQRFLPEFRYLTKQKIEQVLNVIAGISVMNVKESRK
jgi:hypothetical protein